MHVISLLRQRDYSLFWWSSLISGVGNFMLRTALPYYVYSTTGSALASALTFVSLIAPMVLFSATGGVLADRWKRKRIMVGSDFARMGLILPLLMVHGHQNVWLVYAIAFAEGTVSYFTGPFGNASVPNVVGRDNVKAANAAFQIGGYIAGLIGPPIAGFALAQGGLGDIVLADAASYGISGLLMLGVRANLEGDRPVYARPQGLSAIKATWNEWIEGLYRIRAERWIRTLFVVMMVGTYGSGLFVAFVPFVRQTLGGSAVVYGWIIAARAVGGILAGIALSRHASGSPVLGIAQGLVGTAVVIAIMALLQSLAITLVASVVLGMTFLPVTVNQTTLLQTRVQEAFRGRVFGTFLMASAISGIAGSLTGGLITAPLGPPTVLMISAGTALLAAGIAVKKLLPASKHLAEELVLPA